MPAGIKPAIFSATPPFGVSGQAFAATDIRPAPALFAADAFRTPLKINNIRISPLHGSLRSPFAIATDRSKVAEIKNVMVSIDTEDKSGIGESAPFFGISNDTQSMIIDDLEAAARELPGTELDVFSLEWAALDLLRFPSSRAGLEMAFLDALAKKKDVALHTLLNPSASTKLPPIDITIPLVGSAKAEALAAKYQRSGFTRIKVKVGDEIALAEARVAAIHSMYAKAGNAASLELLIDANAAYDPNSAIELLARLAGNGVRIAVFEQPVERCDIWGMCAVRELARDFGTLVFADESVYTTEDAELIAKTHAADGINLKLMKHGGLIEAARVAEVAREHGLKLMIGGMVETRLAMSASLALAIGLGDVHWLDLDTPLLINEDSLSGGMSYKGPSITPSGDLGLGVAVRG